MSRLELVMTVILTMLALALVAAVSAALVSAVLHSQASKALAREREELQKANAKLMCLQARISQDTGGVGQEFRPGVQRAALAWRNERH